MRLDHLLSRVLEQSPSREISLHSFHVPYGDEALNTEKKFPVTIQLLKNNGLVAQLVRAQS